MQLTAEQISDFGVALNEATLLGAEVAPELNSGALTFNVLALPEDDGPELFDARIQIRLWGITRVAASLRDGAWDDSMAPVVEFPIEALLDVVTGFKQPVYGWEFLDVPAEQDFEKWSNRLSLDWTDGSTDDAHTLLLFQEGANPERHLDICFWFAGFEFFRPTGEQVAFDEFAAAGRRWWDGLYSGDPRTNGHGISPGQPNFE